MTPRRRRRPVPGGSLTDLATRIGALSPADKLRFAAGLLEAGDRHFALTLIETIATDLRALDVAAVQLSESR